jgi:hypothetical protein
MFAAGLCFPILPLLPKCSFRIVQLCLELGQFGAHHLVQLCLILLFERLPAVLHGLAQFSHLLTSSSLGLQQCYQHSACIQWSCNILNSDVAMLEFIFLSKMMQGTWGLWPIIMPHLSPKRTRKCRFSNLGNRPVSKVEGGTFLFVSKGV